MVEFRKLISFGKSSFVISLPKVWVDKNQLSKGSLIALREEVDHLKVSPKLDNKPVTEKANLDINGLDPMILRAVVALYKKGIDEININYDDPMLLKPVQRVIGKEAVGYEIIDQTARNCKVKHVSGGEIDFDPLLRKTFLVLISMADESLKAIKENDFEMLQHVVFLEETNNRLCTSCRRALNKGLYKKTKHIGPLYYIVEDLENVADEYKYMCNYLHAKKDTKLKLSSSTINMFQQANQLVRDFYELFYKFDKEKLTKIGGARKTMVPEIIKLMEKSKGEDTIILYHLMTVMQKVFCLIGPYLVLNL